MAKISQACMDVLLSRGLGDAQLEFIFTWIIVREYKRANEGISAVLSFDQQAADAYESGTNFVQAAGAKAFEFVGWIADMIDAGWEIPGWDPTSCTIDWMRFACIMNQLAAVPESERDTELGFVRAGKQLTNLSCPPEWYQSNQDPAQMNPSYYYDMDIPMPGGSKYGKWYQWVLPVAIVAGGSALLWWLFKSQDRQLARANPVQPKLAWNMFAGGTGAKEGKHSYSAVGDFGEYHINPPSVRGWGYSLKWANTQGMHAANGGLWHDLGKFASPNEAKRAASEHAAKLTKMVFA